MPYSGGQYLSHAVTVTTFLCAMIVSALDAKADVQRLLRDRRKQAFVYPYTQGCPLIKPARFKPYPRSYETWVINA